MPQSVLDKDYDVVVVGAGPGGSSCASFLGMQGWRVLLLDKGSFPRDKTCGDALSKRSLEIIQELNLEEALEAQGAASINKIIISFPSGRVVPLAFLDHRMCGMVCRRSIFDNLVFRKAKERCDAWENFKVTNLLFEGENVRGVVGTDANGKSREVTARCVVGADGATSVVGKKLGIRVIDKKHVAVALRGYYQGVDIDSRAIELHFLPEIIPGYFWIFPSAKNQNEANVGIGVHSNKMSNGNFQIKETFESLVSTHPLFQQRFSQASLEGSLRGWSLPLLSQWHQVAFSNSVLVGDAAGLINPLTGEGIGHSLASGKLAAYCISDFLKDQVPLQNYQSKLHQTFSRDARFCTYLQQLFRWKQVMNMFGAVIDKSRSLRELVLQRIFYS